MEGDETYAEAVQAGRDDTTPAVVETPDTPAEQTPAAEGRPRNPDGTFAKTTEEPAEDGDPESLIEQAAEPTQEQLLAGKYKSVDELEKAYLNAQQSEGRLAQELGDLRRLVEERTAQPEPQQQQQPQQIDTQRALEWLEENPAQLQNVLAQAFQAENDQLVAVALAAWEATGDIVGAKQAQTMVAAAKAQQALAQQQQYAQQQQQAQENQLQQIGVQFATMNPDADAQAIAAAAQAHPDLGQLLHSGDPQVVNAALLTLHKLSKAVPPQAATQPDTAAIVRDIARETALAGDQAIRDAQVASAATTAPATTKTRADEIADEIVERQRPFTAAGGWNI
jgi:hypothetical protein